MKRNTFHRCNEEKMEEKIEWNSGRGIGDRSFGREGRRERTESTWWISDVSSEREQMKRTGGEHSWSWDTNEGISSSLNASLEVSHNVDNPDNGKEKMSSTSVVKHSKEGTNPSLSPKLDTDLYNLPIADLVNDMGTETKGKGKWTVIYRNEN